MSSPAAQDEQDIREYDRRVYGHQSSHHRSQPQSQSHQIDHKPRLASRSPSARSSQSSPLPYPRSMPTSATHPRAADGASSGSGSGSGETTTGAADRGAGFSRSYPPAHHVAHHSSSTSSSNLSSQRGHPYSRRESSRDLPRIQFPYPGPSNGPLTPASGSVPPLSSLALDGPRDRGGARSHSGNGGTMGRGLNLPPLHAISGNSPPGHHQPYPYDRSSDGYARTHSPQLPHSSHGPPPTGRSSRESPNLRPSYNYNNDAYPYPTPSHTSPIDRETPSRHYPPDHHTPASAHNAPLPPPSAHGHGHGHGHAPHHRSARDGSYRRASPQEYPDSPPLRAVQHDYHPHSVHPQAHAYSQPHRTASHSHHAYTQPSAGYYPPPDGYPHAHAGLSRSRSHSTSRMIDEPTSGPGQNRRIAHLMSEQKRRESINSGFQSLRNALPGALPTDSKAIILRKAVEHIKHIEGMLHKAGVNPNTNAGGSATSGGSGPALTPSSWDEDGEEGRGDVDMEDREPRGKWDDERRSGNDPRKRERV